MSEVGDDVWIDLSGLNISIPSKYYLAFPNFEHYGSNSPVGIKVKFNLTAYVRDMIAEAVKP